MKLAAEYDPGFEPRYFHNSIIGGVGYDAESAEPYGVTARQWEDIKQRLLVAADEVVLYIVATSNPETLSDEDIAIIDALTDRSLVADDQQVVPPVRGVTHSQLDYKEHKSDHLMRDQENEL